MNQKLKKGAIYGGAGFGALALFYTAYLGFCVLMHVPPERIAILGKYLAKHAEEHEEHPAVADEHAIDADALESGAATTVASSDAHDTATEVAAADGEHDQAHGPVAPAPADVKANRGPAKAGLGVLSTFSIDAPMSAYQMERLVDELKAARGALDKENEAFAKRTRALYSRERLLTEREQQVDERLAQLDKLKVELADRLAQVEAGETALAQEKAALALGAANGETATNATSAAGLATLFQTGEPADLAKRLLQLSPLEAARMLRTLSDDRAAQLLNALPPDKWKDYATTYGQLPKPVQ